MDRPNLSAQLVGPVLIALALACFGVVGLIELGVFPGSDESAAESAATVTFDITNAGALPHNFSVTDHGNPGIANLGISVDAAGGQSAQTTINAPAGTYYFYCNVPGHEQAGMFGYLKVEEGAKIATSKEKVTPRAGG